MRPTVQTPTVLHSVTLPDLIQYIIDGHVQPTLLIVCTSREEFLRRLLHSLDVSGHDAHEAHPAEQREEDKERAHAEEQEPEQPKQDSALHPFLLPTLSVIASSQSTKAAFCSSLKALQAYLSTLPTPALSSPSDQAIPLSSGPRHDNRTVTSRLVLLNPIELHRDTTEFSAQGLSKTFAAAVEAAHRSGQHLIIAECSESKQAAIPQEDIEQNEDVREVYQPVGFSDPWEEEVSILNVMTKSFGAGERGWVGRTVKIRRVAERWCHFEKPFNH